MVNEFQIAALPERRRRPNQKLTSKSQATTSA